MTASVDAVDSPYFIAIILVMMGISSLFWISRNAHLKRRLWPVWLVVSSALLTLFGWLLGGFPAALFMLVASILFGRINLRRIRFCDRCGRTVRSVPLFEPPAQYCPACGAPLNT